MARRANRAARVYHEFDYETRNEILACSRIRCVHLTFGPGEKLGLDIGIFTPAQGGPFPAIILQGGSPPGGTVLPRLPSGPNQGKGEDVLLLVGTGPAAAPPVSDTAGATAST